MSNFSRREFLRKSTATAGAMAAFESVVRPGVAARTPNVKFPTAPRERLAVASWPFRMFIDAPGNKWARDAKQPGIDLKDFGAMVVQKFGLHNIEPLSS